MTEQIWTVDLTGPVVKPLAGAALELLPEQRRPATRVLSAIASAQWAILPDALDQIMAIAGRVGDESPESVAQRLGRPLANTRTVRMQDSAAVIPVHGPIFRRANLFTEISGATSLEVLALDFQAALDDPEVTRIVLDIDSPGGMAAGVSEFADQIRASSKPVTAYVDASGASAAYWLAAAADRVIVSKTAMVGSVGVVLEVDTRKRTGAVEIVSSQSPNKRPDASTVEGRAEIQSRVDQIAQVFIESVAAFRGITADEVVQRFRAGGLLVGAEAVAAGAADAVGSLETATAGFPGDNREVTIMATDAKTTNTPEMTRDYLAENHSALLEDIEANAFAAGRLVGFEDGGKNERERIRAVEEQILPGHEALIQSLKFDGETTGEQAAVKVLQAEKLAQKTALDSRRADAPEPVSPSVETDDGISPNLPIEDRCRAEWEKDSDLRGEFGSFDAFLAFTKATTSGQARILTQ